MTRTDAHAPSTIVMEDYDFVAAYDAHPEEGDRAEVMNSVRMTHLRNGWTFGGVHGEGRCDHCGASIRYTALLAHTPSQTLIRVGQQCLDNRFDLATDVFQRLRKTARLNRERATKMEQVQALIAEHPEMQRLAGDLDPAVAANDFLTDIAWKWNETGTLTEKQVAAAIKCLGNVDAQYAAAQEREARKAALVASGVRVPNGVRTTIEGVVVSTKVNYTDFGTVLKMLVETDEGWKVWGTVPNSITAEKGDRVQFVARVEASNDDPLFGFYSRPTKAVNLTVPRVEEEYTGGDLI